MTNVISRRSFIGSGALAAAALGSGGVFAPAWELAKQPSAGGEESPISLGLASYTFRNFTRAQMIGFMKQLNVLDLNAKDRQRSSSDRTTGGSGCSGGLCLGWH